MITLVGYMLMALLVLGVIIWVINKKFLQTGLQVAKATLGEAGRGLEAQHALKLMRQGIEECAEQAKKARTGLVKAQGSIKMLERQVRDGTSEEGKYTALTKKAISDGKQDSDPVLIQLATTLKRVREELRSNKEQLENQHALYNDLLAQVQNAQRRGEDLEREAVSLGAQLETSKLNAELAEFATSFDAKNLSTGLDGVAKYRDLVRKEIEQNNARLKVNRDLGSVGNEVKEWSDHNDAKDILAELRGGEVAK